jgi:hypothetical protein
MSDNDGLDQVITIVLDAQPTFQSEWVTSFEPECMADFVGSAIPGS